MFEGERSRALGSWRAQHRDPHFYIGSQAGVLPPLAIWKQLLGNCLKLYFHYIKIIIITLILPVGSTVHVRYFKRQDISDVFEGDYAFHKLTLCPSGQISKNCQTRMYNMPSGLGDYSIGSFSG